MKLGTAVWSEGTSERRALVAELPSDPDRVVDLNRLEHLRLAKLGEGWAERMAAALVPGDLRQLLEGGPRAIHRARQVLAYAEKWARRGGLPESLAPRAGSVRMLACLPRPLALRRWDGRVLDRLAVQGPSGTLAGLPTPTLALAGLHGDQPAGESPNRPTSARVGAGRLARVPAGPCTDSRSRGLPSQRRRARGRGRQASIRTEPARGARASGRPPRLCHFSA